MQAKAVIVLQKSITIISFEKWIRDQPRCCYKIFSVFDPSNKALKSENSSDR